MADALCARLYMPNPVKLMTDSHLGLRCPPGAAPEADFPRHPWLWAAGSAAALGAPGPQVSRKRTCFDPSCFKSLPLSAICRLALLCHFASLGGERGGQVPPLSLKSGFCTRRLVVWVHGLVKVEPAAVARDDLVMAAGPTVEAHAQLRFVGLPDSGRPPALLEEEPQPSAHLELVGLGPPSGRWIPSRQQRAKLVSIQRNQKELEKRHLKEVDVTGNEECPHSLRSFIEPFKAKLTETKTKISNGELNIKDIFEGLDDGQIIQLKELFDPAMMASFSHSCRGTRYDSVC